MRRARVWLSILGGILLAGGLIAALSLGGEPAKPPAWAAGKKARDYFLRNPLFYAELRGPGELEARIAAFEVWAGGEDTKKQVAKLTGLAARQLSLMVGQDKPEVGKKILKQVKGLHVALYPPASEAPELLLAIEVDDPAALLKLLSADVAARKLGSHRGAALYRLNFSMNGIAKSTAAAVVGKLVLLSPYRTRLRQALDAAACGQGQLAVSPGFAACAKRFSSKPLWGYINTAGLASAGGLGRHDAKEIQGLLVALGLPSYRWAGFGSSLGAGKTPFEFHLDYFKWSPLASLALPAEAPDPSLAAAVPANALFYAAINVGDPGKAWKLIKSRIELLAPELEAMDRGGRVDEDAGKKAIKEIDATLQGVLGVDLEKDLLPLLSGQAACFFAGGDDFAFGLILGAKDAAGAKKLMANMKVRDGTVGTVGGEDAGGDIYVARVGKNILLADNQDLAKGALAAVAAKKTLADSEGYKARMAALGKVQGAVAYFPVGNLRKLLEAEGEGFAKLLSKDYSAAFCVSLTGTGITWRSTGPVEALMLAPMLADLDGIVRDMERAACRRRLNAIATAATAFARKNRGRWPASFAELGPAFKPGSPARRNPTTGKEFAMVSLGKVPPKVSRQNLVLCYQAENKGYGQAVCVRYGRAHVNYMSAKILAGLIKNTPGILTVADPARVKLTAEEKGAADAAAKNLGSENFQDRNAATKKMRKLGLKAIPKLVDLLKHSDPEVVSRAEMLLKEMTGLRSAAEIKKLAP